MSHSHRIGVAALAILCVCGLTAGAAAKDRRVAASPRVVELFTAQGCSTCPRANRVLEAFADRRGVLPLTFSVDYWDYLGWEDTLARPEFTERQRAYDERLKVREIFTPEVVVQGRAELGPAFDAGAIDALLKASAPAAGPRPAIHFSRRGGSVRIGSGSAGGGRLEVWLVRYDPRVVNVPVKSGENKGQTLTLINAVRELKRLGVWTGKSRTYAAPAAEDEGLNTVVLLQKPKGGPILAVGPA